MTEVLFIGILLCLWALIRIEQVRNDAFWINVTADLRKKLESADEAVDAFAKANSVCVYESMKVRLKNKDLKFQLANRKGQITKLKKQLEAKQ